MLVGLDRLRNATTAVDARQLEWGNNYPKFPDLA
jgi:hypothetical protein